MGIIPLQFLSGQNADTLQLTGKEIYTIHIPEDVKPAQEITVKVKQVYSQEGQAFSNINYY